MAMRSPQSDDWTVERLHALPDDGNRYEIIDGVLYVTPAPRFVHQDIVVELAYMLRRYASRIGMKVMPLPGDVQYSDRTLVQPDLFVFWNRPGQRVRDWSGVHPLQLVVEVLSPSTKRRDRTVKRQLYQAQRIPEYWIVDVEARTVERWRPDSQEPELVTATLRWHPEPAAEPLTIDMPALFAAVLDG